MACTCSLLSKDITGPQALYPGCPSPTQVFESRDICCTPASPPPLRMAGDNLLKTVSTCLQVSPCYLRRGMKGDDRVCRPRSLMLGAQILPFGYKLQDGASSSAPLPHLEGEWTFLATHKSPHLHWLTHPPSHVSTHQASPTQPFSHSLPSMQSRQGVPQAPDPLHSSPRYPDNSRGRQGYSLLLRSLLDSRLNRAYLGVGAGALGRGSLFLAG